MKIPNNYGGSAFQKINFEEAEEASAPASAEATAEPKGENSLDGGSDLCEACESASERYSEATDSQEPSNSTPASLLGGFKASSLLGGKLGGEELLILAVIFLLLDANGSDDVVLMLLLLLFIK